MGDAAVDRWKLQGRLHVWHYPNLVKRPEGWHLNADALACQSIAQLIDHMLAAAWKTRRLIPVSVPSRMLVLPGQLWKPAAGLLLCYPKDQAAEDLWQLEPQTDNTLKLTIGIEKMRQFQETLLGLPHWKDDFALGPEVDMRKATDRELWDRESLWFWTKIE